MSKGWAVAAVLSCLFPFVAGEYYVNLASQIFIFAIFAASINLLLGYGGLATLGHSAYLGLAAYLSALAALKLGLGHWIAAPAALLGTALTAAAFGVIALRASGLGFLMLTLALSQVLWGTALRWVSMTDGDNGLRGLTRPFGLDGATTFYYFAFAVTAFSLWMMARFVASPFGAALQGTRDQPRRMSALGHDVWMIRWVAFILSGFWAAIAGLLFVYYQKFVSPYAVSLQQSAEVLLMTILGGAGTLTGPMLGAIIVTLVKNVASTYVERWNALLGLIFVLAVLFMPTGLVPGVRKLFTKKKKAVAPPAEEDDPPHGAGHATTHSREHA